MTAPLKITINADEVLRKFKALNAVGQRALLQAAGTAGALPILNEAQRLVAVKTGTLKRSLHIEVVALSDNRIKITIGTNLVYAARVEFGFVQADSLGRYYNLPPKPYLRPAFDGKNNVAKREITLALVDGIYQLV